jgi:hypothetical protein
MLRVLNFNNSITSRGRWELKIYSNTSPTLKLSQQYTQQAIHPNQSLVKKLPYTKSYAPLLTTSNICVKREAIVTT